MQTNKTNILLGLMGLIFTSSVWACDLARVTVENGHVLAGPVGQVNTAGYVTIKNNGDTACEVVGASSSIADKVELHTIIKTEGMFKMQQVKSFTVPAKGALTLAQGGDHLMFLQLKEALKVDATVPVTLVFADNKEKQAEFKVKDMKGIMKHH